mmetsp:Transcript_33945/g.53113  ORF Transcript_33945/g.53113 Transcript_33945/m.53113 type:complete len:210 (+) Transcript_33945:628-1257(+)
MIVIVLNKGQQPPCKRSGTSTNVGVQQSQRTNSISSKRRPSIESKPTTPNNHTTNNSQGNIVASTVGNIIRSSSSHDQRNGKSSSTGVGMNGHSTSKIDNTFIITDISQPATTPNPMGKRVIDKMRPNNGKENEGTKVQFLSPSTCDDHWDHDGKSQLKHSINWGRDSGSICITLCWVQVHKHGVVHISNETPMIFSKSQTKTPNHPQN